MDLENTCTRKVTPGLLPPRAPSLALLPGCGCGSGSGSRFLPHPPSIVAFTSAVSQSKARSTRAKSHVLSGSGSRIFFFFAPKVPAAVLAVVRHTVRRVENGEPAPRNRRSDLVHYLRAHSTQSELFPAINPKSLFFSSSSRFFYRGRKSGIVMARAM